MSVHARAASAVHLGFSSSDIPHLATSPTDVALGIAAVFAHDSCYEHHVASVAKCAPITVVGQALKADARQEATAGDTLQQVLQNSICQLNLIFHYLLLCNHKDSDSTAAVMLNEAQKGHKIESSATLQFCKDAATPLLCSILWSTRAWDTGRSGPANQTVTTGLSM